MTPGEIAETVATPYMGFNLGSTKVRQSWDGKVQRHIFESPLLRLMKDYSYRDIYSNGAEIRGKIPCKSVVIYRYYEPADKDLGTGKVLSIHEAAQGLRELIRQLREQVCAGDAKARSAFKVYLVAHSMGGLVCRCFLQKVASKEERQLVDKVFTYATPHNGIDLAGFNVPSGLGTWDISNFNRRNIAEYLGLPKDSDRVDSLNDTFDPDRFFCLVGTNHKDYDVAFGLSRKLAGEMSDGLVRIENATLQEAPRAFVFRSHSGPYGVVNSEEGYQNLKRFLFGNVRVDGEMQVDNLPLPPSVAQAKAKGKTVLASYYFEATVSPRGAYTYKLTERRLATFSAILRKFDDLMRIEKAGRDKPRSPMLFSTYLDTNEITDGKSIVFSVALAVSTTGYEIDNVLFDDHIPGEYLFRDTIIVQAAPRPGGWHVSYIFADDGWGEDKGSVAERDGDAFVIPLTSSKGFKGSLRLSPRKWE